MMFFFVLLFAQAASAATLTDMQRIIGPEPCTRPIEAPNYPLGGDLYFYHQELLKATQDRPAGIKIVLQWQPGFAPSPVALPRDWPRFAEITDYGQDGTVDVAKGKFSKDALDSSDHEFYVIGTAVIGERYRGFWQRLYDDAIRVYMDYCYPA